MRELDTAVAAHGFPVDELIDVKDRQREVPCWKVDPRLLKAMQRDQA